jgi:uncharacterized protein
MRSGAPRSRKSLWRRWGHATVRFVRSVVMLDDTPHRIALGSGIGLFFAFQPFVGSQMVASAIACKVVRASLMASLPWTWLTNPFTVAPIYYASYRLGAMFFPSDKLVTYARVRELGERAEGQGWIDSLAKGWSMLVDIAVPLQVGCTIIGVGGGVALFLLVRKAVNSLQARRLSRRSRWHSTIPAPETP